MTSTISKRGKAWPKHTPSRKETSTINPNNRWKPLTAEEQAASPFASYRTAPLKRKYYVFRAYMQAPTGSPQQSGKKVRANFPMSRNRAIPSSLVGFLR